MVYFILYHTKFKYLDRIYWRALDRQGKGRVQLMVKRRRENWLAEATKLAHVFNFKYMAHAFNLSVCI